MGQHVILTWFQGKYAFWNQLNWRTQDPILNSVFSLIEKMISILSFNGLNKSLCHWLRFLFKFESLNLLLGTLHFIFKIRPLAGLPCTISIKETICQLALEKILIIKLFLKLCFFSCFCFVTIVCCCKQVSYRNYQSL